MRLKKIKFDGKSMKFQNNEIQPDTNLIGLFDFTYLSTHLGSTQELQFSDQIISEYRSSLNFMKQESDTNAAFYINKRDLVTMVIFDNAGKVMSQATNLFSNIKLNQLNIIQTGDKYLINVNIDGTFASCNFKNEQIPLVINDDTYAQSLLVIVDEN
jgi:hypothetical protein